MKQELIIEECQKCKTETWTTKELKSKRKPILCLDCNTIYQAEKEVFDDIDKLKVKHPNNYGSFLDDYDKIKQRHLSTLQK